MSHLYRMHKQCNECGNFQAIKTQLMSVFLNVTKVQVKSATSLEDPSGRRLSPVSVA